MRFVRVHRLQRGRTNRKFCGQAAIAVSRSHDMSQERMVFTGDTIFCGCQTWLMTSDVDQWLDSLEIIRALDVDTLVPGHGPVTDLSYVDKQRSVLLGWKTAVADAVAAGWTKEETQGAGRVATSPETRPSRPSSPMRLT
jgi:glyoxylase-like metal-dependent hydrolase (beta-lactamase superfamily II)